MNQFGKGILLATLSFLLWSCSASQPNQMEKPEVPLNERPPETPSNHPKINVFPENFVPPKPNRGINWVRSNPMFISALNVRMGRPPQKVADAYFDSFHANAIHLWQTGLPFELDGWRQHRPNARFFSWVNRAGTSHVNNQFLGGLKANVPGRIGFQIGDEPKTMADLEMMNNTIKKIRRYDPNALLLVNFGYVTDSLDELLAAYRDMDADIIKYDRYSRSQRSYIALEQFRHEGLKSNRPYWRYLKSYFADSDDQITESDARWDAFSGLLYGFTGHSWFVYQVATNSEGLAAALFEQSGNFASAPTTRHSMIGQINLEIAEMGRVISQLTSTDVRYLSSLLQPRGTRAWKPGAGGDPYIENIQPAPDQDFLDLSVGYFRDDRGEMYTMIQNTRHSNADFPLTTSKPGTVLVDFSINPDYARPDQLLSWNGKSGQTEVIKLQSLGNYKYRLRTILPAGDVIFFKYDTGINFVLQP